MSPQRIGLTMGDPAGVGPELVLRALRHSSISSQQQIVVFGHYETLQRCNQLLFHDPLSCTVLSIVDYNNGAVLPTTGSVIIDHPNLALDQFEVCKLSANCGEAAFRFIESAIDAALAQKICAVTTAPINKEALHLAGHNYPGHTEIFAERAASSRWCMMQYSTKITCTFVTVHCGYSQVPELLTVERILDTIELTAEAIQRIRHKKPKLIVCGLNPHAGEHGLFGNREEERIIEPAIELARQKGIDVEGPLPPDTVFLPNKLASCDAVVCMYHDQGHIPVKALAFDSAVNTTLGLKILRTSVDHGTAFDIAWKGLAKPNSLYAAIELASRLSATS